MSTGELAGVDRAALGSYRVVPSRSRIAFRVRKLGLFVVRGTVAVREGRVEVRADGAAVRVDVDAASFTTPVRQRDRDVRSARFLDAERYPVLSWAGELPAGARVATGVLTVRGESAEVPAELDRMRVEGGRIEVAARLRVDRFAVGVTTGRGVAARFVDVEVALTLLAV